MSRYKNSNKAEIILTVAFVVFVFFVVHWVTGWKCETKADKMGAYAWEYGAFSGCMVKETSDSNWRDVVVN